MGLGGVTVRLFSENGDGTWSEVSGKSPIQTNSDGSYSFTSLAAGTYQIRETPPPAFIDGMQTAGSLGGTTTSGAYDQIQVAVSGQNGTGYDFGVYGLQLDRISLRLFMASTPTGTGFLQIVHTAPTVNLAGAPVTGSGGVYDHVFFRPIADAGRGFLRVDFQPRQSHAGFDDRHDHQSERRNVRAACRHHLRHGDHVQLCRRRPHPHRSRRRGHVPNGARKRHLQRYRGVGDGGEPHHPRGGQ